MLRLLEWRAPLVFLSWTKESGGCDAFVVGLVDVCSCDVYTEGSRISFHFFICVFFFIYFITLRQK
jgi:hypothetical protein